MRIPPQAPGLSRRRVLGVLCGLAFGAGCGTSPTGNAPAPATIEAIPPTASGRTAQIDAVLASAVERNDVVGVVALAIDTHGVTYRGAFGTADEAGGEPIGPDAVFRIASMTKPVTSVAAMQLVERGAIALDEPAARYLPDLAEVQVLERFDAERGTYELRSPASPITLRQLLTHTAGFGYPFSSDTLRDFQPRPEDADVVGPLLFDPGTSWWYGTSTDWTGRLVEAVSGQRLDEYFTDHIFDPLHMFDTGFNVPEADWPRTVVPAQRQADGALVHGPRSDPAPVTAFSGGGGLWSTAADYGRFMQMWLNGGSLDGRQVLSAETVAAMSSNHVGALAAGSIVSALPDMSNDFTPTAPGRGRFGLGFLINLDDQPGRRAAGSLAWAGIYNTYFWIDPTSGVAGVILTQVLPFADSRVLTVFETFERSVYAGVAEPR